MQLSSQSLEIKSYLKQELIDVAVNLFKKFDKGKKNAVLIKDLGTMMRLLGYNPTEKEIKEMVSKLDAGATGVFTKEAFMACLARKERDSDTIQELISAFKVFDKEGTGKIEEKYMRYILCKMGSGLTDEEMDNLMKEATAMEFIDVVNDVKFVKYENLALYLKGLYIPPDEDPKNKGKGGKGGKGGKPAKPKGK
jgi:Ca2+-binding EF-hand superfamily protein